MLQNKIESAQAQQFIPSLKASDDETSNNKKAKTNANNAADSTTETPTTVLKCTTAGPEAACNGTDDSDYMVGDLQRNYMNGMKGDDYVAGSTNEAYLLGGEGNDKVDGEDGNEYLIDGGEGDDLLIGGRGEDVIKGGIGKDNINGGQENDIISHTSSWTGVSDGYADIIDCGDGSDEVWINAIPDNDVVQNCEKVHRGGDLDNDGKEDKTDNCRTISNPDQKVLTKIK